MGVRGRGRRGGICMDGQDGRDEDVDWAGRGSWCVDSPRYHFSHPPISSSTSRS